MPIRDDQRQTFAKWGLIRFDKLIPEPALGPPRDLVLRVLEREGVWRNGNWCGDVPSDWRVGNRILKQLNRAAKQSPAYKDLLVPAVREAVHELVEGRAVQALTSRPQVLFTPPNATAWTVPHKVWHLDVPRLGEIGLPGVQMFSFLHPVAPRAGGTLVVAGSHRLLNDRGRIRSKNVKSLLKREPYFRDLLKPRDIDRQHFLDEPGHVGDVELQVVELHGEPGDVFLTDLRLLHTLAPNTSNIPRLMVTQRFVLKSVLGEIAGIEPDSAE